ncbi:Nephrocystin-3 [Monoraphidium neglectum]|uniref:Nephrocystin-3 n=1 Tax=Monoraphidium neglectum TaxID=145388 RepID=A0A0D2L8I1_9CHLO|nr:Nephrocystin-3 [Monoraphidium neglectum]KIZ03119.1 Nephrocystin-3 [Monoraphidium neglectum]|eukprot:XP_013902138.1 Nephrocystin-3 [Monoraphidium neglectum]
MAPLRLNTIQIPTKVEVYIAPPGSEQQQQHDGATAAPPSLPSKRLGYLSFDSNERSGHQARELKSVHVSVDAVALRLVVHRCHVNKLNIYNQVGIVALNLIGEPLVPAPPPPPGGGAAYLDVGQQPVGEVGYYNRAAADMADLNLDMHVDSVTAAKIRDLGRLKEAAVAAEEYDEAKRLKACIERLKAVGQKVAQLEARKRAAVEREDYDLAKALKSDIDKLRAAGDGAAMSEAGPPGGNGGGPGALGGGGGGGRVGDDVIARVLGKTRSVGPGGAAGGGGGGGIGAHLGAEPSGAGLDGDGAPAGPPSPGGGLPGGGEASAGVLGGGGGWAGEADGSGIVGAPASVMRRNSGYYAYEERPAVARGALALASEGGGGGAPGFGDEAGLVDADPSAVSAAALFGGSGGGGGPGSGATVEAPAPPGWPQELPPPEPVAGAAAKEAEAVAELAGDYVAAAFFSRNWQLRDAGIAWVTDLVRNGKVSGADKRDLARSLARLAAKAMKDKVPNVFLSSTGLLQALVEAMAGGGRDVAGAVEQALPVLIERLSDNNARLRDGSRDALLALAHNRESGLRYSAGNAALLKPVKSQTAWRPVLSTLQLLQDLVPVIGVCQGGGATRSSAGGGQSGSGQSGGAEGLDLGELMDYVGRAFGSANADVRGAAVKVAVLAHDAAGPAVRRLLPRDLNPKIRAQLDAALGVEAGSPPLAAAAAAATPPPKARTTPAPKAASSATKQPPTRASAGGKAAAGAGRKPGGGGGGGGGGAPQQQHHQQQPLPPHLQHSHDAHAQQRHQQQAGPNGGGGEGMPDDPAPFEAELRSREKQYGANHPAVAESCSNLAILFNQRGEYGRAQPLYERALRIYEGSYGPDHQEVAHTLTDLAVLHLEQGEDEVGRPLLERALDIQERALGPDHPDVVAIRDVLNSE